MNADLALVGFTLLPFVILFIIATIVDSKGEDK